MRKLKWKEPAAFVRALNRRLYGPPNRWAAVKAMLLISGGLMAVFLIAAAIGWARTGRWFQGPIWVFPAIALAGGFVFAILVPWIGSVASAEVWFSDKGIHRKSIRGANVRVDVWPWDRIERCTLEDADFGDQVFRVLALHGEHGASVGIGLDARTTEEEMKKALHERGKQLTAGGRWQPPIVMLPSDASEIALG